MNKVLVQPANPLHVRPEELSPLVEDLQSSGMDARVAFREQKGYGVTWWEVVLFWLTAETGKAVINQVVALATEWMRERFRSEPENKSPKVAFIVLYEDDEDEGTVSEVVELRSDDSEPVRRPAEESERHPRIKPPEQ